MTLSGRTTRRALLGGIAAGSASIMLPPMQFADAAEPNGGTTTQTITGHLDPGAVDWVYLPVDVPSGVRQIDVSYSYDKPAEPFGTVTNSLDIGIFDERGIAVRGKGFRGWSGGFRTAFSIAAEDRKSVV